MNRQDILLRECEGCQRDVNLNISRYWVAVGIFLGINTALWGGAAYKIISYSAPPHQNIEWLLSPILVTLFGIGMITIIWRLQRWGERVNWLIRIKYQRMHEIEDKLQMRANLLVHWLDNWDSLSDEQRGHLADIQDNAALFPARPKEYPNVLCIYRILISLWAIIIVLAWLLPIIIGCLNKAG